MVVRHSREKSGSYRETHCNASLREFKREGDDMARSKEHYDGERKSGGVPGTMIRNNDRMATGATSHQLSE